MKRPSDVVDHGDAGDDMLRRFRFQISYTALKAVALLDPTSIASCIYCEQIEDALTHLKDGRFLGTQVKTRELDQPHLRSSDAVIRSALARFCRQDADFSGHFAGFCLATNFAFYKGEGGDDIRQLIACAKGAPPFETLGRRSTVRKQLQAIAEEAGVSPQQALDALSKLDLEELFTGIDIDMQVIQALCEIPALSALPYLNLLAAGRILRERLLAASSRAMLQAQARVHGTTLSIADRTEELALANKRVDAELVRNCIKEAAAQEMTAEQELLTIADYLPRDGRPARLSRMEAKMAAGQLTAMDVAQFKDDVRSTEATFLRWKERFDRNEANRRLQHLEHIALRQCREVSDPVVAPEGFQHPVVTGLLNLRKRLAASAISERESLFGCRPEHLSGAVGLITDECRVWWSAPFTLEAVDEQAS